LSQALQSFAHHKFSIQGCPPASLRFRTTCNLGCTPVEGDSAFEVNEEAWEEEGLRDLVGCLEVRLHDEVIPGPVNNAEPPPRVPSAQPSHLNGELGEATLQPDEEPEDVQVDERSRDSDEQEEAEDATEEKDCVEEEESVLRLRTRSSGRYRRVVASEDEDRPETPHLKLPVDSPQKHKVPLVDDPQPSVPSAKDRAGALPASEISDVSGESLSPIAKAAVSFGVECIDAAQRQVKEEKEEPLTHRVRRSSAAESSNEGRAHSGPSQPIGSMSPFLSYTILYKSTRTTCQTRASFCRASSISASGISGHPRLYVVSIFATIADDPT